MRSFTAWIGGKSQLASTIIPKIPQHYCYAEVFAGAGWVLFKKPLDISKTEILNDVNTELVTLYRVIRHHLDEFLNQLEFLLVSREEFHNEMLKPPHTLTDIQRAARFYYIIRNSYGARLLNPSFSIGTSRPSNFNSAKIKDDLKAAHQRLSRVYIENLDFREFIPRFDRPDTFFYVDPPYAGCENYYGKGLFNSNDFAVLRDLLSSARAKWMMSINDKPEIRQLFSGFKIEVVTTRYSVNLQSDKNRAGGVSELLITNY